MSFARIIGLTPDGLRVAHAPVIVQADTHLRFHLANANALTSHLDGTVALVLVEGPQAYVSANWYADGRAKVPTWNYLAVECEGPVRRLDDAALTDLLDDLATVLEPRVGENWSRAKMDAGRFDAMRRAITGFDLTISDLRGTCKASQNQSSTDAERIAHAMDTQGAPDMAALIRGAARRYAAPPASQ